MTTRTYTFRISITVLPQYQNVATHLTYWSSYSLEYPDPLPLPLKNHIVKIPVTPHGPNICFAFCLRRKIRPFFGDYVHASAGCGFIPIFKIQQQSHFEIPLWFAMDGTYSPSIQVGNLSLEVLSRGFTSSHVASLEFNYQPLLDTHERKIREWGKTLFGDEATLYLGSGPRKWATFEKASKKIKPSQAMAASLTQSTMKPYSRFCKVIHVPRFCVFYDGNKQQNLLASSVVLHNPGPVGSKGLTFIKNLLEHCCMMKGWSIPKFVDTILKPAGQTKKLMTALTIFGDMCTSMLFPYASDLDLNERKFIEEFKTQVRVYYLGCDCEDGAIDIFLFIKALDQACNNNQSPHMQAIKKILSWYRPAIAVMDTATGDRAKSEIPPSSTSLHGTLNEQSNTCHVVCVLVPNSWLSKVLPFKHRPTENLFTLPPMILESTGLSYSLPKPEYLYYDRESDRIDSQRYWKDYKRLRPVGGPTTASMGQIVPLDIGDVNFYHYLVHLWMPMETNDEVVLDWLACYVQRDQSLYGIEFVDFINGDTSRDNMRIELIPISSLSTGDAMLTTHFMGTYLQQTPFWDTLEKTIRQGKTDVIEITDAVPPSLFSYVGSETSIETKADAVVMDLKFGYSGNLKESELKKTVVIMKRNQ